MYTSQQSIKFRADHTPSYLLSPRYNPLTLALALLMTASGLGLFMFTIYHLITSPEIVEAAIALKLALEFSFLALCISAVWKRALISVD